MAFDLKVSQRLCSSAYGALQICFMIMIMIMKVGESLVLRGSTYIPDCSSQVTKRSITKFSEKSRHIEEKLFSRPTSACRGVVV